MGSTRYSRLRINLVSGGVMSGLKINLRKYEIILIGEVNNIDLTTQVLHCRVGAFPITYLDLLLGSSNKDIKSDTLESQEKACRLAEEIFVQRREQSAY
uniref:Putative ovule protein n=1 Tax=Solanum chacoense TaxID=4108 RepID=A0A0V0H142_SOLCH